MTAEPGQGAAGTYYQVLDFTNTGSTNCTLSGYPGVALSDNGGPVGASATRGDGTVKLITLAPGAKAYALLGIAHAGNYPKSTCRPAPVNALEVFPPDQIQSIRFPDQDLTQPGEPGGCQNDSVKLLTIWPLASTKAGANS